MAVISMQKIRLIGYKKHEQKLLAVLQKMSVMEVTKLEDKVEREEKEINQLHKLELDIANLEFAIKLLNPYEKKRSLLEGPLMRTEEEIESKGSEYEFDDIVKKCQKLESEMIQNQNQLTTLETEKTELLPWKKLRYKMDQIGETDKFKSIVGTINIADYEELKKEFNKLSNLVSEEAVDQSETQIYAVLIFEKELESKVRELLLKHKFTTQELEKIPHTVAKELEEIEGKRKEAAKNIEKLKNELEKLAKESENLKITHDYLVWQKDSGHIKDNFQNTEYSFAIKGWVPLNKLGKLEKELSKITKDFEITKLKREEGEEIPVQIRNKSIFWPFESVTRIYGLPLANEVDPTPFLAAFFLIYFALCLTDAGYGLILFAATFVALKWFKIPKQSQGLIKLIMIGGIATFVAGILFGGWFGMTPDQAPGFLTFDKILESGEIIKEFKWQIINPGKGNGPLTFLILAAILGIIQVLTGIIIDGFWKIKNKQYIDALLDSGLWLYFLVSIILFALSKGGIFLGNYAQLFTYMVLAGTGLMILTQGRNQKNIFLKLASGVLSLYNLVGYMADVLSYSRLMALGLGTGIIGFAMNTMAGLVNQIPYIGIVFAIIVILIGHTLNLAISALGAFIHSSRLQFVEFFGKFMEGGGKEFKPFRKDCKYVHINEGK